MDYDQRLSELRKKEDQLFQKERAIIKETRKLEEDLNRFERIAMMHTVFYGMYLNLILPLEIFLTTFRRKPFMNRKKFQLVIWKK